MVAIRFTDFLLTQLQRKKSVLCFKASFQDSHQRYSPEEGVAQFGFVMNAVWGIVN